MAVQRKISLNLSNTSLAFAIPVLTELMNLARSIYLANGLTPSEMGKVLILLLILRLSEVSSNVSGNVLLLQASDGDSLRLQRNLQGFALLRGLFTAVILVLLGSMIIQSTDDGPDITTLFFLACLPIIQGFVHLDYKRRERKLDFTACARVDLGSTFAGLLGAIVFVEFVPNHSVVLAIVASYAISWLFLSHFTAKRTYRLAFDRTYIRRILAFGLPLLLSGVISMLAMQGDRMLIAFYLTWDEVALYGIAAHIALTPLFILLRAGRSLTLPIFREAIQSDSLVRTTTRATAFYFVISVLFFAAYFLGYNQVIGFLYGVEYRISNELCAAFGMLAALRILRIPISLASVAIGKTGHALIATIMQSTGLLLGWYWLIQNPTPTALVLAAVLAELLALAFNIFLLASRNVRREVAPSANGAAV